jgi:hypothetical protein
LDTAKSTSGREFSFVSVKGRASHTRVRASLAFRFFRILGNLSENRSESRAASSACVSSRSREHPISISSKPTQDPSYAPRKPTAPRVGPEASICSRSAALPRKMEIPIPQVGGLCKRRKGLVRYIQKISRPRDSQLVGQFHNASRLQGLASSPTQKHRRKHRISVSIQRSPSTSVDKAAAATSTAIGVAPLGAHFWKSARATGRSILPGPFRATTGPRLCRKVGSATWVAPRWGLAVSRAQV